MDVKGEWECGSGGVGGEPGVRVGLGFLANERPLLSARDLALPGEEGGRGLL